MAVKTATRGAAKTAKRAAVKTTTRAAANTVKRPRAGGRSPAGSDLSVEEGRFAVMLNDAIGGVATDVDLSEDDVRSMVARLVEAGMVPGQKGPPTPPGVGPAAR